MLRTWPVRFAAIEFTLSVRSFQVPATPGTCAWPPSLPSVPTSRATLVTSEVNSASWSVMLLKTVAISSISGSLVCGSRVLKSPPRTAVRPSSSRCSRGSAGGGDFLRLSELIARHRREIDRLEAQAASRAVVDLARGALMERLGCSPAQAQAQLEALSADSSSSVTELAAQITGQAAQITG